MIYRGVGSEKYGDEIMVLQENIIVFKGFLRPQGLLFHDEIFYKLSSFLFSFVKNRLHSNLNVVIVN